MTTPQRKLDILLDAMRRGDWPAALSKAAKFPRLGRHKEAIIRAHNAYLRPGFYKQIGRNPEADVAAGIAALKDRYRDGC